MMRKICAFHIDLIFKKCYTWGALLGSIWRKVVGMIINVALENWMSFLNRIEFSMLATREQHFGERLIKVRRIQKRLLPIAALFGGNASGKTNFCKALEFAQMFITRGHQLNFASKIPVKPFALDVAMKAKPTKIEFTLLVGTDVYEYKFELNQERVLSESLRRLTSPKDDFSFSRKYLNGKYNLTLGKFFERNFGNFEDETIKSVGHEYKYSIAERLQLISMSTRQNQLFLTSTVMQNVDVFKPVFDWFDKGLLLITPTSIYHQMERYADTNDVEFGKLKKLLGTFDTGIVDFHRKELSIDALPFPVELVESIRIALKEGDVIKHTDRDNHFLFSMKGGELKVEKLVPCHLIPSSNELVEFDFSDESDGTRRLLELLPALLALQESDSSRVIIIDEVDRCLHTKATRRFLSEFLMLCGHEKFQSQLIVTTHDLFIMDGDLLRRDEMWAFERDYGGASTIFSIVDYCEARKDSNLRKNYLLGRMGGVPYINDIF